MSRTKEQRLTDIHQEALKEFEKVQTASRDERLQCLQDRRFYSISGAQWEGPLSRQFENKPRLEVNKIHLAVIRIINEYRNNRIGVNFISQDGEDQEKLADTCTSLLRADEQDSVADEAYDNAFEEAVGGGFGAWRLITEYEDEEDEEEDHQRIRIEPIFDADSSVFFDLNAKRQDKADAKKCWVLHAMTYDEYRAEWGEDPATWPKQIQQRMFDWLTPDVIYVAEYYLVEEKNEVIHIYRGLDDFEKRVKDAELKDDPELAKVLEVTGYREVRQKKIKTRRVHKYMMSGSKVLEDCGYIAGKCIPIVPVYGKRWFVDNVERCMGHVRLAKDSQRLKNMQLSKLAEISAASSVEKPIFTPEQIAGHQLMWSDDNLKNYPYLLVNQLTGPDGSPALIGPSQYVKSANVPPAMGALLQLTEQDMQDVLGNQQQADKMVSNISGKAVEMIQTRLDMQTFIYMSNMAKARKRSAEVWLSMAKDVLVESGRKMKGLDEEGSPQKIDLLKPVMSKAGEVEYENDIANADLDVTVDIGPSSSSKRQATVRAVTSMMAITQDPETLQVLGSMAMMNMEGEGVEDVRSYFRKRLVKMGVIPPTEEEAQQMMAEAQNAQPDPQTLYLQAAAEQASAEASKAKANTILAVAKAKETEAKTVETLAGIQTKERDSLINTVHKLSSIPKQPAQPAQPEQPVEPTY